MKNSEYQALPAGTKVEVNYNGQRRIGIICKRREIGRRYHDVYNVISFDGYAPIDIHEKFVIGVVADEPQPTPEPAPEPAPAPTPEPAPTATRSTTYKIHTTRDRLGNQTPFIIGDDGSARRLDTVGYIWARQAEGWSARRNAASIGGALYEFEPFKSRVVKPIAVRDGEVYIPAEITGSSKLLAELPAPYAPAPADDVAQMGDPTTVARSFDNYQDANRFWAECQTKRVALCDAPIRDDYRVGWVVIYRRK